jgi:hypothetical protein
LLKIEAAKESYVKTKAMLETKRKIAEAKLRPIINEQMTTRLKLIYVWWEAYNEKKGKREKNLLANFLLEHIRAFKDSQYIISEKEDAYLKSIYDELEVEVYGVDDEDDDEEEEEEVDLEQKDFEDFLENMRLKFEQEGLDVYFENLSVHTPTEQLKVEIEERIEDARQRAKNKKSSRKKTKKEIQAEALEKEMEEAKKKNVSTIYKSLAKLVHPDLERDETERLKKEEFMKRVNQAYNNNDLFTLLALEQEWLADKADRINELTKTQIKLYIEVLNEQLQEIIIDEASLIYEPENNFIRNFVSQIYTLKRWTPEKQMEQSNNELKMLDNILQRSTKSKKERNAILKELLADFEDDFDSDFEF